MLLSNTQFLTLFDGDLSRDSISRTVHTDALQAERKRSIWQIADGNEGDSLSVDDKAKLCNISVKNQTHIGLEVTLDQKTSLGIVKKNSAATFQVSCGTHKIAVTDEVLASPPFKIIAKPGETLYLVANTRVKGIQRKIREITSLFGSEKKRRSFYYLQIDDKPVDQ